MMFIIFDHQQKIQARTKRQVALPSGEFAWGRGPTTLGYSLSWLWVVVCAPIAGWLYDR
jgi:hypothetical protein